jgi:diphosphomevalonate decarboxylase
LEYPVAKSIGRLLSMKGLTRKTLSATSRATLSYSPSEFNANKKMQVTCTAPVNIAVIKYWGKTNLELILPTNSSLSVTLSQEDLCSTTSILCGPEIIADCMWLNSSKEPFTKRIVNVIAKARKLRAEMERLDSNLERLSSYHILVNSKNNFPTAAGLASSASGFACLTFALAKLFQLNIEMEPLSGLARLGSGSACRSMFGGFVEWVMGSNEHDSLARQVAPESHWPDMEAIVLVVSNVKKHTSSTSGMQQTVDTSPLFKQRLEVVPERMAQMKRAIIDKDFDSFAELTMRDSNQFHAVCLDTYPPIFYMVIRFNLERCF